MVSLLPSSLWRRAVQTEASDADYLKPNERDYSPGQANSKASILELATKYIRVLQMALTEEKKAQEEERESFTKERRQLSEEIHRLQVRLRCLLPETTFSRLAEEVEKAGQVMSADPQSSPPSAFAAPPRNQVYLPDYSEQHQMGAKPGSRRKPVRVAKACDSCRQMKVECDEERPDCYQCKEIELNCIYRDLPLQHQAKEALASASGSRLDSFNHDGTQYALHGVDSGASGTSVLSRLMENGTAAVKFDTSMEIDKASDSTPSLYDDTSSDETTNLPFAARSSEQSVANTVASHLVNSWIEQRRLNAATDVASGIRQHADSSCQSEVSRSSARIRSSETSKPGLGSIKRNADRGSDDSENGEEENRKRRRKAKGPSLLPDEPNVRLLACPYYKYDPNRYCERNLAEKEYRGCASCYLMDVSRLK